MGTKRNEMGEKEKRETVDGFHRPGGGKKKRKRREERLGREENERGTRKRGAVALNARDERVELNQFSPSDAIVPVNSEPSLMNQPTFIETINNTRCLLRQTRLE